MTTRQSHPLDRLSRLSYMNVLGINSGTSLDGLDLCLLRVASLPASGHRPVVLATMSFRFPKRLRDGLWTMANSEHVGKPDVLRTEMRYTEWVVDCVGRFRKTLKSRTSIHAIGFHGQTIAHYPSDRQRGRPAASAGWRGDTTWQIGSGNLLAQQAGVATVSDFRTADVAAGGMGAPLSGYYHWLLFGETHVVLNLGGIANVSVSRRRKRKLEVLAFDIGPGNMLIDLVARQTLKQPCDLHGRMAQRGTPIASIVRAAAKHPYFQRTPPKTCGREEFGERAMNKWFTGMTKRANADYLMTAVVVTADQIGRAFSRWVEQFTPVRSLLLSGGGIHNQALIEAIRTNLPTWTISTTESVGIDPQFVEAAGFAVLANETLHGRAGNLGGATGARPAVLGSIALPISQ